MTRVSGFKESQSGRHFTIAGDFTSENDLKELEELCRDADVGSFLHKIWGGKTKWEDSTIDSLFTVYCTFDDPSLPDGWYGIRSSVKRQESDVVMWFFTLDLFLIATSEAVFSSGISIKDIAIITNDWTS